MCVFFLGFVHVDDVGGYDGCSHSVLVSVCLFVCVSGYRSGFPPVGRVVIPLAISLRPHRPT